MSKQRSIKPVHVWVLAGLLAGGLSIVAGKAGIRIQQQNSNQNSNDNSNKNQNRNDNTTANRNENANANANQNGNANMNANANTGATGTAVGTAALSRQDQKFLMDVAMDGLLEVELGRWAAQQGESAAVKQFGRRMVDDHTKANAELMTLASSKGVTLPTALDRSHQAHVTRLSRMSGAAFDRAYAKLMASDHAKAVAAFERQSTRSGDADVQAFATKTLPTLQEHLQMARALTGQPSGSTNTNSNMNSNSNSNNNANSNDNSNANTNTNRSGTPSNRNRNDNTRP